MRICLALVLGLCLALPVNAQEAPAPQSDLSEGIDLMGEAARLLFRGLMAEMEPGLRDLGEQLKAMEPTLRSLAGMIGDMQNYDPPQKLPNGDIILRRRVPLLPVIPAPPGELDL